jgi:hypothetical protein
MLQYPIEQHVDLVHNSIRQRRCEASDPIGQIVLNLHQGVELEQVEESGVDMRVLRLDNLADRAKSRMWDG